MLAAAEPLKSPSLHLEFNRTGAFTGHDLRDQRIASTFFGAGDALAFTLERVTSADGSQDLPAVGTSKDLTLGGVLAVAGALVKVDVPVKLTRTADGLRVEGAPGAAYMIRTDWGLSKPFDALLALANAQVEEAVSLNFVLALSESCTPR